MNIPKVFISYSHDSLEHKEWVNQLATKMRNHGIDATLDQWELMPGDDLPHFMETSLANADSIIMVCTNEYVKKANKGTGGVGYEKMIITSTLLKKIDSNKVIPIIKQDGTRDIPTFLKSKLYINFSKKKDFDFSYDELIRTIHDSPLLKKPALGNNPFEPTKKLVVQKSNDGIIELMRTVVSEYEKSNEKYVFMSSIIENSNISRLYLETLVVDSKEAGLITLDDDGDVYLTEKGKTYARENNLAK